MSLFLEPNDSFLSKTQYKSASPKGVGGLVAARIAIWAVAVGPKAAAEVLIHDLGGTLWCVKKLAIWGERDCVMEVYVFFNLATIKLATTHPNP